MSRDAKTILAITEPAETSVTICLKGKLSAEYERLEDELRSMPAGQETLAGPSAEMVDVAQRMEALREEIVQWRETFTFRAIPPLEFANRQALIPDSTGMEAEAFRAAYHGWICELAAACLVDPVFTAAEVDQLSRQVSLGDWLKLRTAATQVNTAEQSIPFSAVASVLSRSSDGKSRQPAPSSSPAPDSLAESPPSEPSSSATTQGESLAG